MFNNDFAVIPDCHHKQDISPARMRNVGNLLLDRKPKKVICIGDWWDFPSLSSYDKGKKSSENKRYKYDLEAGINAMQLLLKPIEDYNRSKTGKNKYQPELYFCLGNHEERLNRAVQDAAQWEFTVSYDDLRLKEMGWNVVPFKDSITLDGVSFSHYFPAGLMDKPISGVNIGRTITQKIHQSGLQGHSHIYDLKPDTTLEGKRIWGGSVGCLLDENQWEDYASRTIQKTWFRCIVYLHDVHEGDFDPEVISLKRLLKTYA